jgi:small nuclear ribonucleoprotein (snRNP)-like protein
MDEKTLFLNQQVKVFLKNSWCYTGQVLEIDASSLTLLDKFGLTLSINRSDVSVIQRLEGGQDV